MKLSFEKRLILIFEEKGMRIIFEKELKLTLKKGKIDQLLTTCLGFGINFVFYPSGQSQKKKFRIARFLLQKFSG